MPGADNNHIITSGHCLSILAERAKLTLSLVKILVIGSGGREHAIAWRLSREGHEIFAAPGNPGIAQVATVSAIDGISGHRGICRRLTSL